MDRFLVREPRIGADCPQGYNQGSGFSENSAINNANAPETMYFGGYGAELPSRPGFMAVTHVNGLFAPNLPNKAPIMSGIDPRYLAAYGESNVANYIAGQRQQLNRDHNDVPFNGSPFVNNYENRNYFGADRTKHTFSPQMPTSVLMPSTSAPRNDTFRSQVAPSPQINKQTLKKVEDAPTTIQPQINEKRTNENDTKKELFQSVVPSRADKLKELHKSGVRTFSGPVEKVLKWHKVLQELGIMVLYEIVAKCVSVRPGEGCAKNLVVRDDNGPAMQVVYYEIDFFLPELNPPCTVRVLGRIMPGTSRLQAFSVRSATGDDVATLPRRAAVAAHHVAKLSNEYGCNKKN